MPGSVCRKAIDGSLDDGSPDHQQEIVDKVDGFDEPLVETGPLLENDELLDLLG